MTWLCLHGKSSTIVLLILENRKCFCSSIAPSTVARRKILLLSLHVCMYPHINKLLLLNVGLLSVFLEG